MVSLLNTRECLSGRVSAKDTMSATRSKRIRNTGTFSSYIKAIDEAASIESCRGKLPVGGLCASRDLY